jgi:uncharacterized protein YlxP (DUF503 family)
MVIGLLTMRLLLPGCTSLKEKRGRIKPVLTRLHREYNISTAEVDRLDAWQETVLACTLASNDPGHAQRVLQSVLNFTAEHWPDHEIIEHHIQII